MLSGICLNHILIAIDFHLCHLSTKILRFSQNFLFLFLTPKPHIVCSLSPYFLLSILALFLSFLSFPCISVTHPLWAKPKLADLRSEGMRQGVRGGMETGMLLARSGSCGNPPLRASTCCKVRKYFLVQGLSEPGS